MEVLPAPASYREGSTSVDASACRPTVAVPLMGADLRTATLRSNSSTYYTLLTSANLRNANLAGLDLRTYIRFNGADLRCADLTGVNTTAASGLVWVEAGLSATCPDGTLASAHGNTCVGYLTTGALSCPMP